MKGDIKIENQFLEKNILENFKNTIFSNDFPWFYGHITNIQDINKQFSHIFYKNSEINNPYYSEINSPFFDLIKPILSKIKPISLIRVKLNLLIKTNKIIEHQYHTDLDNNKVTTSILYLNTNNGYTRFEDIKIKSEENKLLTFPSNLKHSGTNKKPIIRKAVNLI
jgi:hypothetical protein